MNIATCITKRQVGNQIDKVHIKFLVAFMCCHLVFEFSVGIGGFVTGLGQISFFFSLYTY